MKEFQRDERRKASMRKHCWSEHYPQTGEWHQQNIEGREPENLLDLIASKPAFVLDSNIGMRAELLTFSKGKAIVLSKTIIDESDSLISLLFHPQREANTDNFFTLGIEKRQGIECSVDMVVIHRLDPGFKYIFNLHQLEAESQPFEKRPKAQERIEKTRRLLDDEKRRILNRLGANSALSLPTRKQGEEWTLQRDSLNSQIHETRRECRYNWLRSCEVAELCQGMLLMDVKGQRQAFDTSPNLNLLGDMRIVQAALFLEAGILSKDGPLGRMANYVGLNCEKLTGSQ